MKISELLDEAKKKLQDSGKIEYLVDAEWLLVDLLDVNRTYLSLHQEQVVPETVVDQFNVFLERRLLGEPLQYILGHQSFYGYDFYVDSRVLIPRFETEELVEKAIKIIKNRGYAQIMDLCSGSGCIGLTILKECDKTKCTFVDLSLDALEVASINAKKLELENRSDFEQSDLFQSFSNETYDLIVSNPPYIKKEVISTLSVEVASYEPMMALDGGDDGLDFYKRIVVEAKNFLKVDGCLMLEIGYDQMTDVLELMELAGYSDVTGYKDLSGNDRIVIGCNKIN